MTIRTETAAAAATPTRWGQSTTHRSLDAAIKAAARRAVPGSVLARVVVDAQTLEALLASGEVYETARGEILDRAGRMAIDRAEIA